MRLTITVLGYELLDIAINEPIEADAQDNEPEFEAYQDAGTTGCTVIGFTQSARPGWERPLNHWSEPQRRRRRRVNPQGYSG